MTHLTTVDCRGLACPQPVLRTKAALQDATSPLLIIVDNEAACSNVTRLAESQGARASVAQQGEEYQITLEPAKGVPASQAAPVICSTTNAKNMVVYVPSERMGEGDEQQAPAKRWLSGPG